MNTVSQMIRNSAYSLIIVIVISLSLRLIFSVIDYNKGSINVTVKKTSGPTEEVIDGMHFKTIGSGEIQLKPTFLQSFILSGHINKDGGATMVFYLLSSLAIIWSMKGKEIKLEGITKKKVAKLFYIGLALFILPKLLFNFLLDQYVAQLTHNKFDYYDNATFFDDGFYLAIIIFNVVYGIIEYAKKLKQENDLTI
ncbi:hypothetical protein [Pedobacter sandarakinus]|uniref:hypothetical protein n=1 Tax=Pedobacter sandarakinus TaxID=353156 RepID=UPI002245993A|nr:hypothetical protein [Pedobacter sandarakinus]MCX2574819.1 hypothetical protein [Pedobacter sandarakinus]